ncbi:S1 RNA-binding domain-containing protein [uncultured Ruthenibacterium sp.]|uniref:S1 RNA-binding domain-containing protein n=1 Tax=uncultured Ruthenibacterium sp. TaxID=1905347 RepID=UPI00349EB124
MDFYAEGIREYPHTYTLEKLQQYIQDETILESRALAFGADRALHFALGNIPAIMPYEECADGVREGKVRDIALLTRVGRSVCFMVTELRQENDGKVVAILSRAKSQQRCKQRYLDHLIPGDILSCRVTHIEPFGAFCDVGCGISALLPIDCLSVSRISSPADRIQVGQDIRCILKGRDEEGRLILSLKELLGTWIENASQFSAGEAVIGIVRSCEDYGVFIELAPNLVGLAEPNTELQRGQVVSVYIKSILPPRMKIKLVVLSCLENSEVRLPLSYFYDGKHLSSWQYSYPDNNHKIETIFDAPTE